MPAGLRTWSASGVAEITTATRFARLLGYVDASSSGSLSEPILDEGIPFILYLPLSNGSNIFSNAATASISGTTVSWSAGADFYYGIR